GLPRCPPCALERARDKECTTLGALLPGLGVLADDHFRELWSCGATPQPLIDFHHSLRGFAYHCTICHIRSQSSTRRPVRHVERPHAHGTRFDAATVIRSQGSRHLTCNSEAPGYGQPMAGNE